MRLETTESPLKLRVCGSDSEKKRIKSECTITNTSIGYRIKQVSDKLKNISDAPEYERYRASLIQELNDLKLNYKEELFLEEDGELYIPSGLYYMGDNHEELLNNLEIKPFFVDGLRYYQQEAIVALLKKTRGIAKMATGTGKTRTMASLALSCVRSGKRVCIVVPSEYLVNQVYTTMKEYHDSVDAASGKRHPKLGQDIMVVTAQSAKKYADAYNVIMIDEAHHMAASTWKDLIIACKDAYAVYSFTATPFRSDGLDLVINALSGNIMYDFGVRRAIEEEWLSPVEVFQMEFASIPIKKGTNSPIAYSKSINNVVLFEKIHSSITKALANNKKVIVLFRTVKAGELFKKFCKGTINFNVATGTFKQPLYDFAKGEANILVACDKLIAEGVDLPDADFLYILTQHSSDVITYQSVGRVLRRAPGKVRAVVIDIVLTGYHQFKSSGAKRLKVYKDIADSVKLIRG